MAVADMRDYFVMRRLPEDPINELAGKQRGQGRSTDKVRRLDREGGAHYEMAREAWLRSSLMPTPWSASCGVSRWATM